MGDVERRRGVGTPRTPRNRDKTTVPVVAVPFLSIHAVPQGRPNIQLFELASCVLDASFPVAWLGTAKKD